MELERVEMSVGSGSVNGSHVANGVAVNGSAAAPKQLPEQSQTAEKEESTALMNGMASGSVMRNVGGLLQEAPEELLNMISTEFYLPMSKLVSRSAQECWNDLFDLVETLAKRPVFAQTTAAGLPQTNDQSRLNLDKKDALLNFANRHKAIFIKLLVLLQWSKRGEDVRKTIELNYWLVQRRAAFTEATLMVGQMMQDLANAQVPNPDLQTAAEVLALGRVRNLPELDEYLPKPQLSAKQILRTIRRLNYVLCSRLALGHDVPDKMKSYQIRDGRATFSVPGEFEVGVSVVDPAVDAKFFTVDFRFLFTPAPSIPDFFLDEICRLSNLAIETDGLTGAYDLLHDLTLSYKLSELHKQSQDLAQGLWAGYLRPELLRRTLVVQYWTKRSGPRSWLEIGIHSGRHSGAGASSLNPTSALRLRWLQNGKPVEGHNIQIDESQLSFENILRCVIAHHTDSIFGSIYDKFLLSPLWVDGELEIEQSSDLQDPAACALDIQLSKSDHLHAHIETVSGAVVLSPVSDRTNRTQGDFARSKSLTDDFVNRVSALRCAIAESKLHMAISNSGWQHLPGLKLTHAEQESVFSQPVVQSNFYRRPHWLQEWMLAVTHSTTGDYWWLTRRRGNDLTVSGITQVLRSRPLHLEGSLTPAYLERLADYTTGIIVLQCNAEHLNKSKIAYRLPAIPRFGQTWKMPRLRFKSRSQSRLDEESLKSCLQPEVELGYHGIEQTLGKSVTVARASFTTAPANLKDLAASPLDESVSILPKLKQVMIRIVAETGSAVVEGVISKLKHVDNIVACATTVKRSTAHTIRSFSLSAITIDYGSSPQHQLQLVIHFATPERKLRVEFLPAAENPHQYMTAFAIQLLSRTTQSLSKSLEGLLALLKMTQPLMTYLSSIQQISPTLENAANSIRAENLVKVHVLPRQAASYAMHYFANSDKFPRDVTDTETPRKLLARLEVLPIQRGQKTLWIVRPSMEEFNSYTRPSFTSQALRTKMQEEIFGKENSEWLSLDGGAAISSENPERLLSKIHECIVEWISSVIDMNAQDAPKEEANPVNINGIAADTKGSKTFKAAGAGGPQQQHQRPMPNAKQQGRPNGIQSGQGQPQRSASNFPSSGSNNTNNMKSQQAPRKQEVITLD